MPNPTDPIPRRRWAIGALLGSGILISFLDRINLSVAGPQLQHDLGLTPSQLGVLFSAFFWPYALLQIPIGLFVDRMGATFMGRIGTLLWTVASAITAMAGGIGGIFAARMLLGIAEAPAFPTVAKATGHWFPRNERARATAIFDASAKFSNVIGVPLVAFIVINLGWRWGFGITSALSFVYFVAYFIIYRDPSADPRLSKAEHEYILKGGAYPEGPSGAGSLSMLGYLLRQTKVWGLAIGFGAYGYSFNLFVTWLPDYMVRHGGMVNMKSAAIPWAVATVTDAVVGGWLIDKLLAKGIDETRVRKSVLVVGMLLGLAIVGATRTNDPRWALLWLSVSLGGLAAAAPVGWSLPSLIAPKGGVGAVSGLMNFAVNLMGIAAPIITGVIIQRTASFDLAFIAAAAVLVVGILAFVFLLGRIEPMPGPDSRAQRLS
jgi:MFS family permease